MDGFGAGLGSRGGAAAASSRGGSSAFPTMPTGIDEDDPELAMALAASLEASAGAQGQQPRAQPPPAVRPGAASRQTSMDYEDELQRAIRASMQDAAGPPPSGGAGGGGGGQQLTGSKRQASVSPDRDEAAEAPAVSVAVPEEPEAGSADAFELAIRLPDGQRVQRLFVSANTVAVRPNCNFCLFLV